MRQAVLKHKGQGDTFLDSGGVGRDCQGNLDGVSKEESGVSYTNLVAARVKTYHSVHSEYSPRAGSVRILWVLVVWL